MRLLKIDSAPLIYAIKGNYLHVLSQLYDKLIIVESVYRETIIQGKTHKKNDAFVAEKYLHDGILEIHKDEPDPPNFLLGAGELAIIHASKKENCVALIDDYKARKIAIQYGIQTVWTMLVFLQALKAQVVDEKTFDTLLATYTKVASPPISEYQIVLSMKKLLLSS